VKEFSPGSILLIRLSSLGDVILTTPLIRALKDRFPEAGIDFLTKKEFAQLFQSHPHIRHVHAFDTREGFWGLRALCRKIRAQGYDLIVDLHVNPRSIYISLLGGGRLVRRYRKHSFQRQVLKRFRINFLRNAGPVIQRYFTAVEDFGIEHDRLGPELYPDAGSQGRAEEILAGSSHLNEGIILGLAPGASKATKRWPPERFSEAAVRMTEGVNACIVLLGSRDDEDIARVVKDRLSSAGRDQVMDLTGRLSLLEAAAVIARLDCLISNDTALMHMATAVNTPVVAVFGPTSRELGFFPFGDNARVVEKLDLDCRPCSLHGDAVCPKGHFRCMLNISPDEVAAAGMDLVSRNREKA
jgi:lipopolysaccharide heptosyltransferase II